jgi:dihydrofolate reductase
LAAIALAVTSPSRHRQTGMKLIVIDFISLDGVVQAPGGAEEDTDGGFAHGGWSAPYFDPEIMGAAIDGVMQDTAALLYGRRTWSVMASAWPGRAGDPFADSMNSLPKHVASRTLSADEVASTWSSSRLLEGDAIDAVRTLRGDGTGAGLQMWGSASFARQLAEADLVDEYRLLLEPIVLGGGKSIFPADGKARPMELVSVEQAATGVLVCTYRPVR